MARPDEAERPALVYRDSVVRAAETEKQKAQKERSVQ
jgi:hypothetical protein